MVLQNANNQLFSAFSWLKSVKLPNKKEENEREWFCKTPKFPRLLMQINPNRLKY